MKRMKREKRFMADYGKILEACCAVVGQGVWHVRWMAVGLRLNREVKLRKRTCSPTYP